MEIARNLVVLGTLSTVARPAGGPHAGYGAPTLEEPETIDLLAATESRSISRILGALVTAAVVAVAARSVFRHRN